MKNGHFGEAIGRQNGYFGSEIKRPKTYQKLLYNHMRVLLYKEGLERTPNIEEMKSLRVVKIAILQRL